MSGSLLLDTCAMIWMNDGEKFTSNAIQAFDKTYDSGGNLHVSPISAWEVGLLIARGRLSSLKSANAWFMRFIESENTILVELTPDILINSSFLPGNPPGDPADRIILATARELGLTVVTRDQKLLDYADAGHIRAIAC